MTQRITKTLKLVLTITVIFAILASVILIAYIMYRTAGEYSGRVVLTESNGRYTVEDVLIQARPERLQGDYLVTLIFHVRVTIEGRRGSLPSSMAEELAKQKVEVTCPAEYVYHVGVPSTLEKVTAGPLTKATFDIPVYITIRESKIRLEPGKETRANIKLRSGCIVIHEYIEPALILEPIHGGPVINIENTIITVKR